MGCMPWWVRCSTGCRLCDMRQGEQAVSSRTSHMNDEKGTDLTFQWGCPPALNAFSRLRRSSLRPIVRSLNSWHRCLRTEFFWLSLAREGESCLVNTPG